MRTSSHQVPELSLDWKQDSHLLGEAGPLVYSSLPLALLNEV